MSDIFRINTSTDIKLTGGSQHEGVCINTDTRDVRTRTELESGAQNAGGNDSTPDGGGISSVYVTGCLTGSGTESLPISVIIDPTGGISCGPNGLLVTNLVVVTGVTATSIVVSGCLSGSGTPSNPVTISLNPTGGLHCTPGGLAVQFPAPTGLNNVSVSMVCITGNGTSSSPLGLLFSPTGGIQCTSAGIALQNTYLTQAATSGCVGGIGTAGSPIVLSINPTGGLQCTAGGLALSTLVSATVPTGCLTGSGTVASPLTILLNPTGGLQCTAGGLAINMAALAATGTICYAYSYESGTAPLSPTTPNTPLSSLSSGNVQVEVYDNVIRFWAYNGTSFVLDKEFSGGGGGSGVPGSPTNSVQFNNAGSFGGSANLTYNGSTLFVSGATSLSNVPALNVSQTWNGSSNTSYSGVIFNFIDPSSASSVSKMLDLQINGTSTINFQKNGTLSANYYVTPAASAAGLYARSNTAIVSLGVSDDVQLTRDAANSLAQRRATNSQAFYVYNNYISTGVYERGAFDWIGSPGVLQIGTQHAGSGVPRGLQLLTSGTPRIDISAGGAIQFNSLYTFPQVNGSSGQVLTTNGAGTLTWATPSGGGGSAASPSGAVQFNNGTTFGGASNFTWDNVNNTLNVTGTITTRNITNVVYAITDGTGVDINPNNGAIQVWSLGASRTPTASFFNPGQAVTLMIDDGSGNSIDWSTINPTWLDGSAPSLPVSGYGLVELWKVGSTIYGASLASGVASGGGTPASPTTAVQFNSGGSFAGSSDFTWNGSTLSVTGTITSKNVATSVYTISDGTGVVINPANGGIQLWTLGASRTPTAPAFAAGESVTLMIDDGSGYTVDWNSINVNWIGGSAPTLATSGYTPIELWKVGSTVYGVGVAASGGTGTPASPTNSIQFNNGGAFGGSSNLTWDGNCVMISGVTTSGAPILNVAQRWNGASGTAYSGVIVNFIDPSSAASTSKLLDLQVGGSGRFNVTKNGDAVLIGQLQLPYIVTTSANSAGLYIRSNSAPTLSFGTADDIVLTRDAADILAQRRSTNAQAFRVYNTYLSTGVYERGTFDWAGSPGVLQIGTQHGGSGVPRGLQLITSGTPRIDIQAGGAIQFYGAYTFPSTNGSSGQVLTTNGAGTLTWGAVSGAASSADYFIDETDEGNSGTSITINFGSKANHKLTLTGHCTLSFTAPASARETKIRFVQGGTGGYTITLPSGTLGTTPVLPTGVGQQSVVSLFYDRDGNWHV